MAKTLDVYRDWLQIQEPKRPLNHYQLLRLKKFEDDPGKIREHYRKLNTHVRKFAGGQFATESQELLNELAKSMLCLTDLRRKREYDASLGRADEGDERRRSLEEILLLRKVLDTVQLEKARKFSTAVGVELRDAVLQQRLAKPDAVLSAFAESIGLPFLDLEDVEIDTTLMRRVPAFIARQHSCVPVMVDSKQLLLASPNPIDPHVEEELRLRFGMPVRTVLATPSSVHELVNKHYSREAAEAELAAGADQAMSAPVAGGGGNSAPAPAAKSGKVAKVAKAAPEPSSPEAKKQQLWYSLIAFNFAFMLYQVIMSVAGKSGWGIFMLGFPVALVVGLGAYAVLKLQR